MRDAALAAPNLGENEAAVGLKWDSLHASADQVAALAAITPQPDNVGSNVLGAMLSEAAPWQRDLAARGVEDIEAMMARGLEALATLVDRGAETEAPALALWREFHHSRDAVLATLAPRREAA